MENVTPQKALDNLYGATRKIPAEAEMHEYFKTCFQVLLKAITPAPAQKTEGKTLEEIVSGPETPQC